MSFATKTVVALTLLLAPPASAQGEREALWEEGHLLYRRDELDRAEEVFREAERLGPHWYGALMLGAIEERRFRFARALDEYRRALALEPTRDATRGEIERVESIVRDLSRFREANQRLGRDLGLALVVSSMGALLAFVFALRP